MPDVRNPRLGDMWLYGVKMTKPKDKIILLWTGEYWFKTNQGEYWPRALVEILSRFEHKSNGVEYLGNINDLLCPSLGITNHT